MLKYPAASSNSVQKLKQVFSQDKIKIESLEPEEIVGQINGAAEFASLATGVRKDFLMGMLVVESDLGRNVGKCTWEKVERDASRSYQAGMISGSSWRIFQKRKQILMEITNRLERDADTTLVSCNPSNYAGTGGAMGFAQFMPDTWLEYQNRIAGIVGKDYPDPWNVQDAVVAMALKLSDVPGVKEHLNWAEANAAKIYLSGSTSHRFNWYAQKILYWSRNYRKLMV